MIARHRRAHSVAPRLLDGIRAVRRSTDTVVVYLHWGAEGQVCPTPRQRELADALGDKMTLGAGTVLDPETARACILAGAQFLVTPALKVATIEVAHRYSKIICPGSLTPTEVLTAWEAGADFVKVFPCSNMGGAKYIKALKGPFPQIEMIPTGGVNLDTAADFLKAGSAAVAVGSELIDAQTIKEGKYEVFEERARQFLAVVSKARAELSK